MEAKFTNPPNDIAYTIQQGIFFRKAHAGQIEAADGAEDAWREFMHALGCHKDYLEETDVECREIG